LYKDILGSEIKVGHVISVARYGRGNSLSYGIVTRIVKTKKAAWVYFAASFYANGAYESKAQLGKDNSNISILKISDDSAKFNNTVKSMIFNKILPSDYVLGEPVVTKDGINLDEAVTVLDQAKKVVSKNDSRAKESLLDSLGAPKSLGGI
jgi:hypothetical protein